MPRAVLLFAALAALPACAHVEGARLCESGCEAGQACFAGRCHPSTEVPAPAEAERVVLAPIDLAVIGSKGDAGDERLAGGDSAPVVPAAIALGLEGNGTVELLFRFAATWREGAEVSSAYLVLDPVPGARAPEGPIPVEVARIVEPWRASTASWGRQPRLDLPQKAGAIRVRPGAPVRVDVTALVRRWAERSPDDHGIALIASGRDPVGAIFSTGAAGAGPRLEVYVK